MDGLEFLAGHDLHHVVLDISELGNDFLELRVGLHHLLRGSPNFPDADQKLKEQVHGTDDFYFQFRVLASTPVPVENVEPFRHIVQMLGRQVSEPGNQVHHQAIDGEDGFEFIDNVFHSFSPVCESGIVTCTFLIPEPNTGID